jgi:nitrate reductase gamma subunit
MTVFLYLTIYTAASVFACACLFRALRYARTPIHLRWELYPIPHEEPERVKHGGSYFEASDWWKAPRRVSLLGEIRFMIPEMLFLKGLWEFNRKLWYRSFAFHFGLYLLIATIGLSGGGAFLSVLAPHWMAAGWGNRFQILYGITGAAGSLLAIFGSLALARHRLRDPGLRIYTTAGDLFNLAFFVVALLVLSAGYLSRGPSAPDLLAFAKGLITFDRNLELPVPFAAGLLLAALLVAYVPLTHMSHFIAKFFTYHSIRWDDAPNHRGGRLEARIAEYLTYRPTWSAAHLAADGRKTWAEVAAHNPAQEGRK